jgi:hypothetical protein
MKLKEGFVLRKVADTYLVVAVGEQAKQHNVMIKLNDSGAMLWEKLTEGAEKSELISAFLDFYDIDEGTAAADVEAFIQKLDSHGLLCD